MNIAAWTNGAFTMIEQPEWFEPARERIWAANNPRHPTRAFGEQDGQEIRIWNDPKNGGEPYIVGLNDWNGEFLFICPTDADLLDFLTARGPAWLKLGEERPMGDALRSIARTLISYARHGGGQHIDMDYGSSSIDTQIRHEQEERALRHAAERAAKRHQQANPTTETSESPAE